jgi:hypothetical protein
MNRKLCGSAHLDVHVFKFAAHRSLPSFSMMRPASAALVDSARIATTSAQQAQLRLAILTHPPAIKKKTIDMHSWAHLSCPEA